MKISLNIIKYCAEEVQRQGDCPEAVYWMIDAWHTAQYFQSEVPIITPAVIEQLGTLVSPDCNIWGFRNCQVRVGDHLPPSYKDVPRLINQLCQSIDTLTPEEFYKEFQTIHPFADGNGRTGKILYNWLKGTLDAPIMPPNFWGISNP